MMRLYVFKDEVGMALIAARSPVQARQMATWEWGKQEPIHVGDAPPDIQDHPEVIEEIVCDRKSVKRWGGRSLLARMWDELDITFDRIMGMREENEAEARKNMKREKSGKKARPLPADPLDILAAQNYAQGVAFCIMHIQSPYSPDLDAVREQATDRWEERNGG